MGKKKTLKWLMIIVVFGIMLWAALSTDLDYKKVFRLMGQMSFTSIVVLVLLSFMGLFLNTASQHVLLRGFHQQPKFGTVFMIMMASLAANYTTPAKVGLPLRVVLLKDMLKVPVQVSVNIIFLQLVFNMALSGLCTLIAAVFILGADFMDPTLVILAAVGIVVVAILGYRLATWLSSKKSNWKVARWFTSTTQSVKQIDKRFFYLFLIIVVGQMFFSGFAALVLLYYFDQHVSFFALTVVGYTTYFIGAISMIPLGLGARDSSLVFLLKQLGVAVEIGSSIALVQRLLSTGLSFVLGLIFIPILGGKKLKQAVQKYKQSESPEVVQ